MLKHGETWRVTNKGKKFLFADLQIPKYAYIYNNQVQRYGDEIITAKEIEPEVINFEQVLEHATKLDDFTK